MLRRKISIWKRNGIIYIQANKKLNEDIAEMEDINSARRARFRAGKQNIRWKYRRRQNQRKRRQNQSNI